MPTKLLTKFSEIAFDKVGHYNPQLLREWQGRLRWRNLLFTGILSLVVQGLLLGQRFTQLPLDKFSSTTYCVRQVSNNLSCQLGPDNFPLINWPFVWADVFRDVSFVMVWALIVGGVYLLAADLSKESRRGTLNFLRMSPLSTRRMLIGKLLGVPILLYLGVGAMVPLHLATGLLSQYPVGLLSAFYGLLGAIAFCFYTASLWFTLLAKGLKGFQSWLMSGLSAGVLLLSRNIRQGDFTLDWFRLFNPLHILSYWEVQGLSSASIWPFGSGDYLHGFRDLGWFFLPVGSHSAWYGTFALANALMLGLWFWVVLERKFQTPAKTALGKGQSYGVTLCLSVLMLGFNMQQLSGGKNQWAGNMEEFWSYPISMMIWGVLLMFLLLPAKQRVLDWARYRHQQPHASSQSSTQRQTPRSLRRQRSLLAHLIHHDGSPSVLAYGTNLGIIAGVLLLGLGVSSSLGSGVDPLEVSLVWFVCAAVLMVCALVVQWIALSNLLHWGWVAFAAAAAMLVGWPVMLGMLGVSDDSALLHHLWLTTVIPQVTLIPNSVTSPGIAMAIATHLTVISTLSLFLSRRCQHLGESEWKALMKSNDLNASAPV